MYYLPITKVIFKVLILAFPIRPAVEQRNKDLVDCVEADVLVISMILGCEHVSENTR